MPAAGRVACIFTPMLFTLASFVCLILIQLSGWSSPNLNGYYFAQANFTNLDIAKASKLANSTELTAALTYAKEKKVIAPLYQIHLWNYCTASKGDKASNPDGNTDFCTEKQMGFIFDPLDVWQLNATNSTTGSQAPIGNNDVQKVINSYKNKTAEFEKKLLGDAGEKTLEAYRTVAKWMFIAYQVAFWCTAVTIAAGLIAICSRWGSLLTWIFAVLSSIFTFGAVLSSTLLFAALVGALKIILNPYGVEFDLNGRALALTWLAVVFIWIATLFWMFSICCCSGRSNPHHRSNKGGMWVEDDERAVAARYRGTEKLGSGSYQRVASPYLGNASSEHVPLQSYPQPMGGASPQPARHYAQPNWQPTHAANPSYEPYRSH